MSFGTSRVKPSGFTLIELLIVIAIIAILALIAVPNFLEAQTRAKVTKAIADMRAVATALESYCVDYNVYVHGVETRRAFGEPLAQSMRFQPLTTPIAYLTQTVQDPFVNYEPVEADAGTGWSGSVNQKYEYGYESTSPMLKGKPFTTRMFMAYRNGFRWYMSSVGPRRFGIFRGLLSYYGGDYPDPTVPPLKFVVPYDPTNGTVSWGHILRSNKNETSLVPFEALIPNSSVPDQW